MHKTSSPRYAQSNGLLERHIQTIKKLIQKAQEDNKDIYLCLLDKRNTPLSDKLPSPAQLLFGRRLNGIVPTNQKLLIPNHKPSNYREINKQNQLKTKQYYNTFAKELPEIKNNTKVLVQNFHNKKWDTSGTVIKKDLNRPRSYVIRTHRQGNIISRNRRHLHPVTNNLKQDDIFDELLDKYIELQSKPNSKINQCNQTCISGNDNDKLETNVINDTTILMSRSGREIKKPIRFKDYV